MPASLTDSQASEGYEMGSREWEKLAAAARRVSREAHAPYSGIHVGAALASKRGRIYAACNVENSSLGLTICAERGALFRAVAEGEREFSRLVIYAAEAGPLSPCGACRQVLSEFCRSLPILSIGRGGIRREFDLAELLPDAFAWPDEGDGGADEARAAGEVEGSDEGRLPEEG